MVVTKDKTKKKSGLPSKKGKPKRSFRCTRIAPWRNKLEFTNVHDWLFGADANADSKEKAYQRMVIWKIRRLELTPATILSTLSILDVQMKDTDGGAHQRSEYELKMLYSSALTRFLNYMSSLKQTAGIKTMYATAKELGLESFLVDLRHLCAHGQEMPSLEVFRKTAEYCMDWLKKTYWDYERRSMKDVDEKTLKNREVVEWETEIREYFDVYDSVNEAIVKQCQTISEARKKMSKNRFNVLKTFVNNLPNFKNFAKTSNLLLKKISECMINSENIKDTSEIFLDAFLNMKFLFDGVAEALESKKFCKGLILNYQTIFRKAAVYGVVENIFYNLVNICEDDFAEKSQRKAAEFWANKILKGFVFLLRIKERFKQLKDKDPNVKIDSSIINNTDTSNAVKDLYKDVIDDPKQNLIFSDVPHRPWSLVITRQYLTQRISSLNEYTAELINNCFPLVHPPISDDVALHLKNIICLHDGLELDCQEPMDTKDNSNFDVDSLDMNGLSDLIDNDKGTLNETTYFGKWKLCTDGYNWSSCPLGRLPWQF